MPLWRHRRRSRSNACSSYRTQAQVPLQQSRCLLLLLLLLLHLLPLVRCPKGSARLPQRAVQQARRDRVSSAAMVRFWVLDLGERQVRCAINRAGWFFNDVTRRRCGAFSVHSMLIRTEVRTSVADPVSLVVPLAWETETPEATPLSKDAVPCIRPPGASDKGLHFFPCETEDPANGTATCIYIGHVGLATFRMFNYDCYSRAQGIYHLYALCATLELNQQRQLSIADSSKSVRSILGSLEVVCRTSAEDRALAKCWFATSR